MSPTPSESPSVVAFSPWLVGLGATLRGTLRSVARSVWPSPLLATWIVVRRLLSGRVTAGRTVRVGGALALAGVASVSGVNRPPTGDASGPSVRQAFAEVTGAVGRVGAAGARTPSAGVAPESLAQRPANAATTAQREGRRRPTLRVWRWRPLGLPVRGPITSEFGMRVHPVTGRSRLHRGVDLAVPVGTPVVATAAGRVLSVGPRSGYGLVVEVEHRSPDSRPTSTLYAHLSALTLGLRVGLDVRRGTVVGFSGGMGEGAGLSTGPHVHYEVRTGGRPVDPTSVASVVRTPRLVEQRVFVRRQASGIGSRASAGDRRRPTLRGIP